MPAFSTMPMRTAYFKTLKPGALAFFQYLFFRHDNSPLILVTDAFPDHIRGVNLHFLSFNFVKRILGMYCGKPFSYANIKHDNYVRDSFRSYKRSGIRGLKILDCPSINNLLQDRRKAYKYNPQELQQIREQLRKQLVRMANPRAEELAGQYIDMLNPQQSFQQPFKQDARFAFRPNTVEITPPNPNL